MFVTPASFASFGRRLTHDTAEQLARNWTTLLLNGIVLINAGVLIFSIDWSVRSLSTFLVALGGRYMLSSRLPWLTISWYVTIRTPAGLVTRSQVTLKPSGSTCAPFVGKVTLGAAGTTNDSLSEPTRRRPLLATPRKLYLPLGKRRLKMLNGTFLKGGSLASRNLSLIHI